MSNIIVRPYLPIASYCRSTSLNIRQKKKSYISFGFVVSICVSKTIQWN